MPERSRETGAPALKRLKISPRAMALAAKSGADISKAVPTGPMGRIIERDIERLLAARRLRYQKPVDVDAQRVSVNRVERILNVYVSRLTAGLLGLGDYVKRNGCLT